MLCTVTGSTTETASFTTVRPRFLSRCFDCFTYTGDRAMVTRNQPELFRPSSFDHIYIQAPIYNITPQETKHACIDTPNLAPTHKHVGSDPHTHWHTYTQTFLQWLNSNRCLFSGLKIIFAWSSRRSLGGAARRGEVDWLSQINSLLVLVAMVAMRQHTPWKCHVLFQPPLISSRMSPLWNRYHCCREQTL